MRLPRPRLTVRALMILVALMASTIMLAQMARRRAQYLRKADQYAWVGAHAMEEAKRERDAPNLTPDLEPKSVGRAVFYELRAARFHRWSAQFRDAAWHPWRSPKLD